LGEKMSKYGGLGQENGFGLVGLDGLQWLVKCATTLCTCRKECNKYDRAAAECF
jgi:hypothetical protein